MWLRLMRRLWPLVVLPAFLTPSPAAAVSEFQGEVVSVLDGDTIEVLCNHHAERIPQNIGDPCGGERPGGCVPLTHAGNRTSNGRAGGWTRSLIIEAIWQAGCRSRPCY